jgi:hypothetical protein
MKIPKKYYPVVPKYVKQRILIRIKHLNYHRVLINKKRKDKVNLQRLQKRKRLMT